MRDCTKCAQQKQTIQAIYTMYNASPLSEKSKTESIGDFVTCIDRLSNMPPVVGWHAINEPCAVDYNKHSFKVATGNCLLETILLLNFVIKYVIPYEVAFLVK